jgi:hypothetical protein
LVKIVRRLAAVTPSPVPGKRDLVVEYLLVNSEGKILAVLQSPAEVARQLARIESKSEAHESVRVVRHDEHEGELVAAESFVTATPLPSLMQPPRRRERTQDTPRVERPARTGRRRVGPERDDPAPPPNRRSTNRTAAN